MNEAERELVDLCRDFAQNEIARRAPAAWDEARCPTDLLREMGALGLLGMLVPEQWGGIGMSTVGFVAAMEQIGLADQSVAAAWQAHVTIGSMPLYLFGDDDQRERWLRPLAEGRALGAYGHTEPDAGSDARGIRTRAEPHDGGYVINGRKTFISNAGTDMSFGVTLLARVGTSNEDAPRYASFVVEQGTPGYTMGPKLRGIGWRGLDTRELFFDDVWVPDDHLIGDADLGLSQFLRTLEVGRISIAALSLSLTQAVLDLATGYAGQRVQFGQLELHRLELRDRLAELLSLLRVVEREVEHRLGEAERQGRDGDAAHLERAQELAEPHGRVADKVLLGDPHVVEVQLPRIEAAPADAPHLRPHCVSRRALLHHEAGIALVGSVGPSGAGQQGYAERHVGPGVGDERLAAVDHPAPVMALRPGLDPPCVGARIGFREPESS